MPMANGYFWQFCGGCAAGVGVGMHACLCISVVVIYMCVARTYNIDNIRTYLNTNLPAFLINWDTQNIHMPNIQRAHYAYAIPC